MKWLYITALLMPLLTFAQVESLDEVTLERVVINGNLASDESETKNFTVKIEMFDRDNKPQGGCTGVIIANDMILTAGHCFPANRVKATVSFGLGGEHGFTHKITTTQISSLAPAPYGNAARPAPRPGEPPSVGSWNNGSLVFNTAIRDRLLTEARARTDLVNSAVKDPSAYPKFHDYALIRVGQIPRGYSPIKFYTGPKDFNMYVYGAGHGYNSHQSSSLTGGLRWSRSQLIGHHTRLNEKTIGWETINYEGQNLCFGDSGGPNVVWDGYEFKLLGITTFTTNACAGTSWIMSLQFFVKDIRARAAALRAVRQV